MVKTNGDEDVFIQNQSITGSNITLSGDYNLIAKHSWFSEHYIYSVQLTVVTGCLSQSVYLVFFNIIDH